MKYIKRIINIITSIFIIMTVVMLIFSFIIPDNKNIAIPTTLGTIIVISYLIILFAALLSIIVAALFGIVFYIKKKGAKRLIRNLSISCTIGIVISVLLSLIKYHTFFSLNVIYIPIACAMIPTFSFFQGDDETDNTL